MAEARVVNQQQQQQQWCTICFCSDSDSEEVIISTPCHHTYHLNCLKEIVRPQCPVCRRDIRTFLIQQGLTDAQINRRVNNEEMRICYEEMKDVEPSEMDPAELATLCEEAVKQHPDDWGYIYRDILFDRISNAAHLFARISHFKHQQRNEPGLFMYSFTIREFIASMISSDKSECTWLPLSQIPNGTDIKQNAVNLCARLRNRTATDFAVLVLIRTNDDVLLVEDSEQQQQQQQHTTFALSGVLSIDPPAIAERISKCGSGYVSGVRRSRIAHRDVLVSLLKCRSCRCSGVTLNAPNPEYKWAKNYVGRFRHREQHHHHHPTPSTEHHHQEQKQKQEQEPPIMTVIGTSTFAQFLDTFVAPKLLGDNDASIQDNELTIFNEKGHGNSIKCVKKQNGTIAYALVQKQQQQQQHNTLSRPFTSRQLETTLCSGFGRGGPIVLRITKQSNNMSHIYQLMYQLVSQQPRNSSSPMMMKFVKFSANEARRNNTTNAETGELIEDEDNVVYM